MNNIGNNSFKVSKIDNQNYVATNIIDDKQNKLFLPSYVTSFFDDIGQKIKNKYLTIDKENKVYELTDNGLLIDKSKKSIVTYMPLMNKLKETNLILPSTVNMIEDFAFANANDIIEINCPESINVFGESLFENCNNLKVVNINAKNTVFLSSFNYDEIIVGTTYNCNPNTIIKFKNPNEIKRFLSSYNRGYIKIDDNTLCSAISKYPNLTSTNEFAIEKDYAGYSVIANDIASKTLIIPEGVTTIKPNAFSDNFNLETIKIPNTVSIIDELAFENCENLKEVNLPINIVYMGHSCFNNCNKLAKLFIPASLTNNEANIFTNCANLGLEIDKNNKNYKLIDQTFFVNYKTNTLVTYLPKFSKSNDINIPNGIKNIGCQSFENTSIKSLYINKDVEEIESMAFNNCFDLEKVDFEKNSNVSKFSDWIFNNCKKLKQISIPKNVKEIGYYCFQNCESLSSVEFESDSLLNFINDGAFYNCKNLKSIEFKSNEIQFGIDVLKRCESLTKIKFNDQASIDNFLNNNYDFLKKFKILEDKSFTIVKKA